MFDEGLAGGNWRCPQLSRVVHNVNNARKFGKYTDVTFVVGPDGDSCIIKAHRVVVGTANDELAKLVSGSRGKIRIPDVSPKGFKNLIRFLYDIDVKFSDLSVVRETRLVAEKFKVYKLKLATEHFLNQAVKFEPILEILEMAIEFEMSKLELKCIDIISTKYQQVLRSEELVSASFEVLASVLSTRPCIGGFCQYEALLTIGKWMKRHKNDNSLRSLMSCVDFTLLRIAHFNDFIEENEGLLSDADIRAFRKYILTKEIAHAPKWYQSTEDFLEEEDCIANTEEAAEKNISAMNYLQHFEVQKSKLQKSVKEELCYMQKVLTEAAEVSVELNKMMLNETVQEIVNFFSVVINEGIDTTLESIENELKSRYEKREENRENIIFGENEANSPTKISLSDIGKPFPFELCSTDGCCIEDDLNFHNGKREEKVSNSASEISAWEIGKPFASERCSTDTSCIVPKCSAMVL